MDAQFPFANYRQHDTYTQYPPVQSPSQSHSSAYSDTYYYAPPTPAFSPGSSSTGPNTPAVPTPPPVPSQDFRSSAYETQAHSTYGGWGGPSINPYSENSSFFQPHVDTNVDIDVQLYAPQSEWCSGAVLRRQHCQPPSSPLPLAALLSHDHFACAPKPVAPNHLPTASPLSSAHPSASYPGLTDKFRTHWDKLGNLVRTPVPTTCGYPDCAFVGPPDDLWRHIVHAHHPGSTAATAVQPRWDGCGTTVTKPMKRRSLHRHILDTHLQYQKLHCPYCHYTSRDNEYEKRHGNNPAMSPERAAWEAHEGEGWALRDHCPWCQVITPLV